MEFVKSSVGYEGLTIDQKMQRYSVALDLVMSVIEETYQPAPHKETV